MARKVFLSFHFDPDSWRASTVRGIGALEGNQPVSANDWETVKRGGDPAIKQWIGGQMKGRTCAIILVGTNTASRPWVKYEIKKAWEDGLGVVGVRIHGLKNSSGETCSKGANPFTAWDIGKTPMSDIVTLHDPAGADSKAVYANIEANIDSLVEKAIAIRAKY